MSNYIIVAPFDPVNKKWIAHKGTLLGKNPSFYTFHKGRRKALDAMTEYFDHLYPIFFKSWREPLEESLADTKPIRLDMGGGDTAFVYIFTCLLELGRQFNRVAHQLHADGDLHIPQPCKWKSDYMMRGYYGDLNARVIARSGRVDWNHPCRRLNIYDDTVDFLPLITGTPIDYQIECCEAYEDLIAQFAWIRDNTPKLRAGWQYPAQMTSIFGVDQYQNVWIRENWQIQVFRNQVGRDGTALPIYFELSKTTNPYLVLPTIERVTGYIKNYYENKVLPDLPFEPKKPTKSQFLDDFLLYDKGWLIYTGRKRIVWQRRYMIATNLIFQAMGRKAPYSEEVIKGDKIVHLKRTTKDGRKAGGGDAEKGKHCAPKSSGSGSSDDRDHQSASDVTTERTEHKSST
jgi:hypothetical protein